MSESIIADFVGKFNSEQSPRGEPIKGRVVLSQKRLVLAANEEQKVTIALPSIFDIAVGHVPEGLGDFFNSTVTIAFENGDQRYVAAVEAEDETIDKFTTVLFKAMLNGTDVTVQHPARLGGRVTDAQFEPAKLNLKPRRVVFERENAPFAIRLSTVTSFKRLTREIGGRNRPVLGVRHMHNGQSAMTLAALPSSRKMNILGRYLRLEYSEVMAELESIDLSDDEIELLVAMYSTGDASGIPLANIVDKDSSQVTMLLNDLSEDGLVTHTDEGPQLTPKGQVVVSKYLEDVNA